MARKVSKSRTRTHRTRSPSSAAGAEKSGPARGSDGKFKKREVIPASGPQEAVFAGVAEREITIGQVVSRSTSGISQVTLLRTNSPSSKRPVLRGTFDDVSYNGIWALIVVCLAIAVYLFATLKH